MPLFEHDCRDSGLVQHAFCDANIVWRPPSLADLNPGARELLPHGDAGATLEQLSANGYASTEDCKVEPAMGAAGTVYLCHPFLVHAAQPHRGERPRFMAQPPLLPKGEFDPALPPSPVQVAIRQACGLTF